MMDDTIHLPELLHLQAAEGFCRCSVDGIEDAVFLLIFPDFPVDITHDLQGEFPVLGDGLAIIELLQLIEGRDAEGGCHGLQQGANLLGRLQMTAIEASLAIT